MYRLTLTNMAEDDLGRLKNDNPELKYEVQNAISDLSENPDAKKFKILKENGPGITTCFTKINGRDLLFNLNRPRQTITVLGVS